jgi:hypothetical protein
MVETKTCNLACWPAGNVGAQNLDDAICVAANNTSQPRRLGCCSFSCATSDCTHWPLHLLLLLALLLAGNILQGLPFASCKQGFAGNPMGF